jgi:hypothetical protein
LEKGGHSLATNFSSNFDPKTQNTISIVQFRLLLFSVNPTKEIPFPAEPGQPDVEFLSSNELISAFRKGAD